MAMTILLKRGSQTDIDNLTLMKGETALAYSGDNKSVALYAGDGNGGIILVNPDVSSDITSVLAQANGYTDEQIAALVNGAPEAMNTLSELAEAMVSNEDVIDALNAAIGDKVDKVEGKELSSNDYTDAEKEKLDGVAVRANNYVHPSTHEASMITQDSTHRFVSDIEKASWDDKLDENSTVDGGTF